MFGFLKKRKKWNHLALGRWGEKQAARYLRRKGWRIIERNFNCSAGEIDLIADDDGMLVFVEVRTRNESSFGSAEQSVDAKKEGRISRAAEWYLNAWPRDKIEHRFDIVAVELKNNENSWEIKHYRAAF